MFLRLNFISSPLHITMPPLGLPYRSSLMTPWLQSQSSTAIFKQVDIARCHHVTQYREP
jgi:hypothetical protein